MNFAVPDSPMGMSPQEVTEKTREESALLARAQAGDERAFRELVEPHRKAIELHCYRMLGSLQDAEDVTQETLLRAWRRLDSFRGTASIHTWLYRIATNACLDEIERRPRRAEPAVDPYPDHALDELDPAARYEAREGMALAFLTAIQRLPGRQRAVLILRDVLGWTGAEVAELLDSTVASVNSALQRARVTIEREAPARAVRPQPGAHQELLRRYVEAWDRNDIDSLTELLHEDALLSMPPQPSVVGAGAIIEFFRGVQRKYGEFSARALPVNGQPAVAISIVSPAKADEPHRLLVLDCDGERVSAMHAYSNPELLDKLGV